MKESVESKRPAGGRKKLGELLLEVGLMDERTLRKALRIQKIQKKRLGQVLIDMGVADHEVIAKALAGQLGIPFIRVDEAEIPEDVISLVPSEMAQNYLLVPIRKKNERLVVAMANPLEFYAVDDLRFVSRMDIDVAVAPTGDILRAVEKYYPKRDLETDPESEVGTDEGIEITLTEEPDENDPVDLMRLTELPPIIQLANNILADAIKRNATDIHIEPQKETVVIRYRVDGVMREAMRTGKHIQKPLVSRIKVISNMDIAIGRKPQDGRSQVKYGNRNYDLRVSTIPTSYGEKLTIRILDQNRAGIGFEALGFSESTFEGIGNAIRRPHGIILVTGPTGSGKTSTLYACLNKLNSQTVNITTVEDPIEFDIPGINQVQINPKAGVTFAAGLRSILRQDPDIVMVGEIRDAETASTAFQAAQTGHLVLATLHTNDAPSAVTRLLDLGVEAFLISSSLIAVLGQRLVRKICPECKVPASLSPHIRNEILPHLGIDENATFWKGIGCEACQHTGYSGRLGIFEFLTVSAPMREMIGANVSDVAVKKAGEREGFTSMTMDGMQKALQGLTTVEEVLRVAPPEGADELSNTFFIPFTGQQQKRPEERSPEPPRYSASSIKRKTILVADDNEMMLKIVCKVLQSRNCLTITAEDGVEAMKLALEKRPDLIITDLLMPKMDGNTLVKELKSQSGTRDIPIIMLSAKDNAGYDVTGDAHADDYLTKPVDPKQMLASVYRLLGEPSAERTPMMAGSAVVLA